MSNLMIERDSFCRQFASAQKQLELSDLELAKIFQISLPTVGRWARGEAAPHPIGREPVLRVLRFRGADVTYA